LTKANGLNANFEQIEVENADLNYGERADMMHKPLKEE
jgi:hypothetical protein